MDIATPKGLTAGDHTEAMSRATTFDDGAGHKMKAVDALHMIDPARVVKFAGVTGGDTPAGTAF